MKITVAKGGFDFSEAEGKAINLPYDTLIQLIEQLKVIYLWGPSWFTLLQFIIYPNIYLPSYCR